MTPRTNSLRTSGWLSICFIESVAVIPTGTMWFPRPKTSPAKLSLTSCTYYVITSTILLNSSMTPVTLLLWKLLLQNNNAGQTLQTFVLQWIQFEVSLSSSHFFNQPRRYSHLMGRWGSRPHWKLNNSHFTQLILKPVTFLTKTCVRSCTWLDSLHDSWPAQHWGIQLLDTIAN